MSYKPTSLFSLMHLRNQSLFLPHIQRPFVWTTEQMTRLMDSLMRDYPIQTLLFWKTKDEIKARKFMDYADWDVNLHELYDPIASAEGAEKTFVLDGQQRLQTLFALFGGGVKDKTGSQQAYLDLLSGDAPDELGLLYRIKFDSKSPGPTWYRVVDLITADAQKNAEAIAEQRIDALDTELGDVRDVRRARERLIRRNIAQLVSLLREDKHFWVQELDGIANEYPYEKVVEIFVRVNSGGTKLDQADLMFAAMKQGWDEIEQKVEEVTDLLNDKDLDFDKTFALKCLAVTLNRKATLHPRLFQGPAGTVFLNEIKDSWEKAEDAFEQLRDFLRQDVKLYSGKLIRGYSALVPVFDYLYRNPKPDPAARQRMLGYFYKSQLFGWFSSSTDNTIDQLHTIMEKHSATGFPMTQIKSLFSNQNREVEFAEHTLDNSRARLLLLNLAYVSSFGTSPFDVRFKNNEPHVDHIYPKSMLASRLGLASVDINDIGNFRFIGASDNLRKRAELPDSYFQRLKAASVPIAKHLLVPEFADDPGRLKFDEATYLRFRDERRKVLFALASKVVNPEV